MNSKASEDELNYPTKMNSWFGYLQGAVDSADTQPTEGELQVFAELSTRLDAQLGKWRELLSSDLPALNDAMRKNSIPLVAPSRRARIKQRLVAAWPSEAPRLRLECGTYRFSPMRQVV